ncbi:hypothetical protein MNBD_DELTA03-862 [hydrothermal vent metagenome]|uniref:Uncharacterized protein n=1 Tax=hydrothermal vent metagenome TaxID=652676 RepID=A0A3B0WD02_9ZZZZ
MQSEMVSKAPEPFMPPDTRQIHLIDFHDLLPPIFIKINANKVTKKLACFITPIYLRFN